MNFLQQLDMFFSVANGLVFAVVCLLVIIVVELRKSLGLNVTHYQRTDMVDMSLSANEYMIHLRNGDIRGEWKPVFNGKFLPLDAGVMEAHLAAKAECELKDMLTEAYAMNDQWDEDHWFHDEAEAIESGTVVNVVGYCSCKTDMGSFKPFRFTTTRAFAEDTQFLDMIAHNHCEVCNPDLSIMLADEPVVEVISEHIEGQRVTFTFTDGSTAIMRECEGWGSTRHLDAPSEHGYRVDTVAQANAINRYTNSDCIPF